MGGYQNPFAYCYSPPRRPLYALDTFLLEKYRSKKKKYTPKCSPKKCQREDRRYTTKATCPDNSNIKSSLLNLVKSCLIMSNHVKVMSRSCSNHVESCQIE